MYDEECVGKACADLRMRDREVFRVLHIDVRGRLISYEDVSVGTLSASLVHPREVFKGAIMASADRIILVHNHPSDGVAPSPEDLRVTEMLCDVGRMLHIPVDDHVIVGPTKTISLRVRDDTPFLGIKKP